MTPWFESPGIRLYHGDCLEVYRGLADRIATGEAQPLDAVITDPPAGIDFMGRRWDKSNPATYYQPPFPARSKKHLRDLQERHAFVMYWAERFAAAYDCLKEDGIAIVWAIPRTADWTAEALRLAGFFIRDKISHVQAQGWPKTRGALRPLVEEWIVATKTQATLALDVDAVRVPRGGYEPARNNPVDCSNPWGGSFGQGPNEAQKRMDRGESPLGGRPGNVVFSHDERCERTGVRKVKGDGQEIRRGATMGYGGDKAGSVGRTYGTNGTETVPAYCCVAGCETCGATWLAESGGPAPRCECGESGVWCCPVAEVDAQGGNHKSGAFDGKREGVGYGSSAKGTEAGQGYEASEGGPSRYFSQTPPFRFVSKCGPSERDFGCEELFWRASDNDFGFDQITRAEFEPHVSLVMKRNPRTKKMEPARVIDDGFAEGDVHPTVKPLGLCLHLLKLSGARRVGDLCAGSGAFAIAAWMLGIEWIGAEYCIEACVIARARLDAWQRCTPQAIAEFKAGGDMPRSVEVDERQRSLF